MKKRNIVHNEKSEIGNILKKRRETLSLLQPQLSEISGVSVRTIQFVEQGKGNPSLDTLIKITDALGLRIKIGLKEIAGPE